MKIQKMISLVSLTFLFSHSLQANCGGYEPEVTPEYLRSNNIILKSENIDPRDLSDFVQEYEKFPISLRNEMQRKGGKIHLIHGMGVTEDPTWRTQSDTKDGRSWSTVPGAGGAPFANMPTRIVVNRLREGHGSTNLFLHEDAHSLDSTYRSAGVSKSNAWKELMRNNPQTASFLSACGEYCNSDEKERFAELFAIYYESCGGGKEAMERQLPEVAAFFSNLNSVQDVSRNRRVTPRGDSGRVNYPDEQNVELEEVKEKLEEAAQWAIFHGGVAAQKAHEWSKENVPKAVSWSRRNGGVAARVVGRAARDSYSWTTRKVKEVIDRNE